MNNSHRNQKSDVAGAATNLLHEGKKWANEMRDEGLNQVSHAEENIKEYSDQVLRKVQANPLASVLIAAGVGYLFSKLIK